MLFRSAAALALLGGVLWASATFAQAKRVALVIGNSAYHHTPQLANPRRDATDISAALKNLGYEVVDGFDLDKASFDRTMRDFSTALQGAEAAVFYYAGHGLQVAGQNYLVPIDAQLTAPAALEFEMVRLDVVHRIMEREAKTNILFLDACRDNPLSRNLARAMGTRSAQIGKGLAPVESGVGTLISFSTQPGNVALDGVGRNSPFASSLAKHMALASDDLSAILIAVRNDVMKDTQSKQIPWEHSALTGRFYFGAPPLLPGQSSISDAAREWLRVDKTNLGELETFVRRQGSSPEADYARARIGELKKVRAGMSVAQSADAKTSNAPPAKGGLSGVWTIARIGTAGCLPNKDYTFNVTISNNVVSGRAGAGESTGSVNAKGELRLSHPSVVPRGSAINYTGELKGNAGKGTFQHSSAAACSGTFAAKRN